jgi:DNA polymerase-1
LPEDHISIKVLMGDKGDNIPGVNGVGIKRAETLVKSYGDGYDIYSSLPINSRYKYIQNLNDFGDQLLLNYQLMDLVSYCEDAIGEENIQIINEVLENE